MAKLFAVRWAAAIVLVFGTFNPTGRSYYHWVAADAFGPDPGIGAAQMVIGLAILISFAVFLRATWRSIGLAGLLLVFALLGAIVWLFHDWGLLTATAVGPTTYVGLLVIATALAVGISWSHIRRRLTGQVDTGVVGDAQ